MSSHNFLEIDFVWCLVKSVMDTLHPLVHQNASLTSLNTREYKKNSEN